MSRARCRTRRLAVIAAVAAGLLSACTGVPTTSTPETIEPIHLGDAGGAAPIAPTPGADPRRIVQDFLTANAIDAVKHTSARAFLTKAAQSRWSDVTATIIDDEVVGTFQAGKAGRVSGRVVGTLSASGIYTPSLQGIGAGGSVQQFGYRVVKDPATGENRIDGLPSGLLLRVDQFQQYYKQRSLYFYDLAEKHVVPDARWSALTGVDLDDWLMNQLVSGPRAELRNAVTTDTLPLRAIARRLNVTQGSPTEIEIPGASQLDPPVKVRLAAQVAHTLNDVSPDAVLVITDGGSPVSIPETGGAEFSLADFSEFYGPPAPAADVFYLRDGNVVRNDGTVLKGALNDGAPLTSVALSRPGAGTAIAVAAETGTGADATLLVGTQTEGLRKTGVKGALSRPAWVPGLSEVWVGSGGRVYRLVVNGRSAAASQVSIPSTTGGGRIIALRLSPEGSRVAIVIATNSQQQQLFIGSIVRSTGQVRVDALQAVSPDMVVINDLAWIGGTKLLAIGYNLPSTDARIFETNVDGSLWTARTLGSLPDPPDSVTAAVGQLAWVSVNSTVFLQDGRTWASAVNAGGQTPGDKPIYLE